MDNYIVTRVNIFPSCKGHFWEQKYGVSLPLPMALDCVERRRSNLHCWWSVCFSMKPKGHHSLSASHKSPPPCYLQCNICTHASPARGTPKQSLIASLHIVHVSIRHEFQLLEPIASPHALLNQFLVICININSFWEGYYIQHWMLKVIKCWCLGWGLIEPTLSWSTSAKNLKP